MSGELFKIEAEAYAESIALQRGIAYKSNVRLSPTYPVRIGDQRTVFTVEGLQLCFKRPGGRYNAGDLSPDAVEAKLTWRNSDGEVTMTINVLLDYLMRVA